MKLTAALLTVFVATSYALACSCMAPPPPAQAMEKSVAVFSGTVTKVQRNMARGQQTITITVDRSWKGIDSESVTLFTGSGGGDCGFNFKEGEAYLVYAHKWNEDKKDNQLGTNICTRTKSLASAKEDLDALGEGKKIEAKK